MTDRRTLERRMKNLARTRQITSAMQLIASIKLKRVQKAAETGRRYLAELNGCLALALDRPVTGGAGRLLVVIGSDRGFAGNANALVEDFLRHYWEENQAGEPAAIVAVGRRAVRMLGRFKREPILALSPGDDPSLSDLEPLTRLIRERLAAEPDLVVEVVSLRFRSLARQQPEATIVYPPPQNAPAADTAAAVRPADYQFEPDRADVAGRLAVRLLDETLLSLLREAKASEHVIRMRAMRQATENADTMLTQLALARSRMRQQQITQEILEIVADAGRRGRRLEVRK